MKIVFTSLFMILAICSCSKKNTPRSAALPDNVTDDKPIVLKEGQAIILMMEGDRNLMIGATVADGELTVSEIDTKGRSFGVTWKDTNTWDTSTTVSDGANTTFVLDKNGDGYADFKTELNPSGTRRFELQGEAWIELNPEINTKESNKAEMATPRKLSD
jgi:hypothetical protein